MSVVSIGELAQKQQTALGTGVLFSLICLLNGLNKVLGLLSMGSEACSEDPHPPFVSGFLSQHQFRVISIVVKLCFASQLRFTMVSSTPPPSPAFWCSCDYLCDVLAAGVASQARPTARFCYDLEASSVEALYISSSAAGI